MTVLEPSPDLHDEVAKRVSAYRNAGVSVLDDESPNPPFTFPHRCGFEYPMVVLVPSLPIPGVRFPPGPSLRRPGTPVGRCGLPPVARGGDNPHPTAELSGLVGRVNVEFSGAGAGSFLQLSALVKYQRILREFDLDCEFSFETFGEALYPFDPDLAAIRRLVEDDLTRGCGGCFTATDPH